MDIIYSERYECKSCGGSRSLAFFDNSHEDKPVSSFCFSCQEVKHDALSDKGEVNIVPKQQVSHDRIIEEIRTSFPIKAIPDRGISEATAKYFGIRVGLSETNGQDIAYHYIPRESGGQLVGYQVKVVDPKRFYNLLKTETVHPNGNIERIKEADFYGTSRALRAGSFKLVITEGAQDMATAYRMLMDSRKGRKNEGENVAVVSTLDGVSSLVSGCVKQRDFIERFREVVLCMDQDDPGRDATAKAAQLMASWNVEVKVARFSEKDPGDMWKKRKQKEFTDAIFFNASAPRPKGSVSKERMLQEAFVKAEMGIPLPYPQLNDKVYGIQKRVVMGVGAGVGIGKTTFMTDVAKHLVDTGHKPGMFYFEESTGDAMKMLAIPYMKLDLLNPKVRYDEDKLMGVLRKIADRVQLASEDIRDWKDVKDLILEWVLAHELNPIILDPISNICPSNPSEANEFLNTALGDMTHIAKMHDIGVVVTSHLNRPIGGPPHEEGGRVQEGQFTGSAAMRRWCKVILGIERNKQATGEIPSTPKIDEMLYQPGVSCIRVLKNRVGRWTGPLYYEYSHETFGYKEL